METVNSLNKQLIELGKRYRAILDSINKDKEVVKAEDNLRKVRSRITAKVKPDLDAIDAQITDVNTRIFKLKTQEYKEIPMWVNTFLENLNHGVDYGSELKPIWWSDDERFIIITNPGHTGWYARGSTKYYVTEHRLMDLKMMPKASAGIDTWHKCMLAEHEGRLTKDVREVWDKIMEKQRKENYRD